MKERSKRFRVLRARSQRDAKRRAARRTAATMVRNLGHFLRLLMRLMADSRVSVFDRSLFGFVLLYVLAPTDLIPDFLWMLGLFDDVYLIGLALSRLLVRAGPDILLEHWSGNPRELGFMLERLSEVGRQLPRQVRRTLGRLARQAG